MCCNEGMGTVIPLDYAHVVESFAFSTDAEPMVVTYGVGVDPAALPANATALATTLGGLFDTHIMPLVSSDVTHIGTEVTWQSIAPPAPPDVGYDPSGVVGSAAGALMPQNNAFLVHKRTGLGGRGGRGRFYIPGVQEGNVGTTGVVAGATVAAWNTNLAAWRTAVNGAAGVLNMVLLHSSPGAYAATVPYDITSLSMDTVIATQRRRLRP